MHNTALQETIEGDGLTKWFTPRCLFKADKTRVFPGSSKAPLVLGVDYKLKIGGNGYVDQIIFDKPLRIGQTITIRQILAPMPAAGETWWVKLPDEKNIDPLLIKELTDKVVVFDTAALKFAYKRDDVEFVELRFRPSGDLGECYQPLASQRSVK